MKLIKNALVSSELPLQNILFDECIRSIQDSAEDTVEERQITEVIDAEGKLVIPGGIDPHVHFNDPGFTNREDFMTGTASACAGGITTVIDMPCTSLPPVTDVESLNRKLSILDSRAYIDYALWGGVRDSGSDFSDYIEELWQEGVAGFKIYTISGMDTFKAMPYDKISELFRKYPDALFAFHAEDSQIIESSISGFSDKELSDYSAYVKCRPVEAEYLAVKSIIDLMVPDSKCHFVHISSEKAAKLIIDAKSKFHNLTFETCPHYLEFTCKDYADLRGRLKTAPPVKFDADRKFLRSCVGNGKIDFIASDHAGCIFDKEKNFKDFSRVYNGIPGTQFMIPYLVSEFLCRDRISIDTLVKITSANAARRYGLYPRKGSMNIGSDADFVIIDLNEEYLVNEKELLCKGKYSPFEGFRFKGNIKRTILRGNTVFRDGNLLDIKPAGKRIRCLKTI